MGRKICEVDGCNQPMRSRAMCSTHYERWRRQGDSFDASAIRSYGNAGKPCTVAGCGRDQKAIGMCKAHYDRARLGQDLDAPIRRKSPPGATYEEAFAEHSKSARTPSGCIEWSGSVLPSGYGVVNAAGDSRLAHRLAWELANGSPVPPGLVVRHSCDNRLCVNGDHLLIGTHHDNSGDMVSRSRQANGERVPTAKMTEDSVGELLRLRGAGMTYKQLAEHFGIGKTQACNIVRGVSWKHLRV